MEILQYIKAIETGAILSIVAIKRILSKTSRSLQCLNFFGLRWIFSLNSVSVLNRKTLKENEENELDHPRLNIRFEHKESPRKRSTRGQCAG